MIASVGVVEFMLIADDRPNAANALTPTPKSALNTGNPAATNVPSMMNNTMAAMMRPAISPGPTRVPSDVVSSFEKSTRTFGTSSVDRASTTACF